MAARKTPPPIKSQGFPIRYRAESEIAYERLVDENREVLMKPKRYNRRPTGCGVRMIR
jgi:hypothetical protein